MAPNARHASNARKQDNTAALKTDNNPGSTPRQHPSDASSSLVIRMVQLLGCSLVLLVLLAVSDARRLSHMYSLYGEALPIPEPPSAPSRTLQASETTAFLGTLPLRVITSIPSALTGDP